MTTQAQTKEKPTVSTLYKRPDVIAQMNADDEAEQKAAENQQQEQKDVLTEVPDDQLSPEERTFKKRYSDLRRHSDRKTNELVKRVKELEQALAAKPATPAYKIPKTDAELAEWRNQYPDVADIVETIAHKRAEELASDVRNELETLRTTAMTATQELARTRILEAHPDFDDITGSDEFWEWLNDQEPDVRAMVEDNIDNAGKMIAALKLYKIDAGIVSKKSKKETKASAATAVEPRTSIEDPTKSGKKIWKTSEIAKLNARQFAEVEAELDAANREGRIVQG